MKKQAYVWRKSIYTNGFKCTKCGRQLFIPEENRLGDAVVVPTMATVACLCGYDVAYITEVDVPKEAEGLMGDIEDYRNANYGGQQ